MSTDTIDGDIWPTLEVVNFLEEKLRTRHKRKLAVFGDTIKRWDVPLHYYIDSSFSKYIIYSQIPTLKLIFFLL